MSTRRPVGHLLLVLVLLVLTVACDNSAFESTGLVTPEFADPLGVSESSPATPVHTRGTPYPAPAGGTESQGEEFLPATEVTLDWASEPGEGLASVHGFIVLTSDSVLLGELFLASAVTTSSPGVELLELDTNSAPRAQLERGTGQFLFRDVQPGRYGLIAWEPLSSTALNDPASGQTLFISVSADDALDIGTLQYP